MALGEAATRERLAQFLCETANARSVDILELRRLSGGAVQENWLLLAAIEGGALAGRQKLVLRTDAATSLSMSRDRASEFAVQRLVHAGGVTVPEPLFLCCDAAVIGKPFFVMRWLPGVADGERIVAGALGGSRAVLAERLAQELANLHKLRPKGDALVALGAPPADAAAARLGPLARFLAAHDEPHPAAEWGVRWLMRHAPPPAAPVLCHGDFRTGNYLADERGFIAMLDWDFAGWGDPDEDIGWFCLAYWRFGAYAREAGGLVPRAAFHRAYEAASGRAVDPARTRYWEVMAALRWLVIALEQRDRFLKGGERSLQLLLNGRRPAECELEILRLTEQADEAA
ncbi:MAG TPA: phosphotransferase family protein [Stellaceae bacterium]|nr:phosphotransferase family protein [Stellaceae bacterium]